MTVLAITLGVIAFAVLLYHTFNLNARRWAVWNHWPFRSGAVVMGFAQAVIISETRYGEMPEVFDLQVGLAILVGFGTFIWAYLISDKWPQSQQPETMERSAEHTESIQRNKSVGVMDVYFAFLLAAFIASLVLSFFEKQLIWWPPFGGGN